ncbi:conserved hypothetical protein [Leishmania braziliensis MHOM/BR/75/M2904]|uniref:Uncharacterized protein n=2 Tax=Leishmania braziliensis TaxID=5660 RepID=A4H5Q7_LEIBR|nr:conserved hypothetical protein [Leishmania braziliensis MHOM/BR/75/M2904]CAJ2467462.1 unnamed protein product [Leishmania braziliensis]CAM41823.2 conserved hypothetical protein [Leishmania braziliensis MHOM/BR/75/M2904]SYZ63297.1 hypothetical_protein [Leishmania braziliensis MHOM/BR/75/M2904]
MALLEEARRQLDAEVCAYYVRSTQPTPPLAPSLKSGVSAAATAGTALTNVAATPAGVAQVQPPKRDETGDGVGGKPHRTPHVSSGKKCPNVRQARARLQELIKNLQCATIVTAQVSLTEDNATPALRRSTSKGALSTLATIPLASSAAAARQSGSGTGARERAADADAVEGAAASRVMSRPPSPTRSLLRMNSTLTSATTAETKHRSVAAHNPGANLRRLNASSVFAQDCLHYATALAEAGLGSDAQSFFLEPIAHDITSQYELVVARCVEQQPRVAGDPLKNPDSASAGSAAPAASMRTPRRPRLSLSGGHGREDRKRTCVVSGTDNTGGSGARDTGEDVNLDEGNRVTDDLDVFAPDVPLPLALRLHKCVMHYQTLALYIRFGEIMESDVCGDAADFATALEACACVEQLVALEQRVLHTPAFSADTVLKREAAQLKEDVGHSINARPKTVSAITVAGCRLVDVMAEPLTESPPSVALTRNARARDGEAAPRIYVVEDTAAPVLFTMRRYVANMCERLLAYLSSTSAVATAAMDMLSSPPSVAHAKDVASAITRRLIKALCTSLSMSELHHLDTHGSAPAPPNAADALIRGGGGDKTCFPLAVVEYLPWRLHEYSLLQSCYTYLQEDPSSASTAAAVAQRALHQVLQLMELEYLDPVPPPASSVHLLETAVQQCAGQLLVAIWRAAVVQNGSPYAVCLSLPAEVASKLTTNGNTGESPPNSTAAAAATASSAMASITALAQQTAAHLLSMQWSTPPGASAPSLTGSPPHATQQRGQNSGNSAGSISGTRLLVTLWTCIAQVQQQCMLLAGKSEAADALRTAAISDVQYDNEDTAGDGTGEAAEGGHLGSLPTTASSSPGGKSKKGKAWNSSVGTAASGKHKLDKAAETAQLAEQQAAATMTSPLLPTSIAHPHPSVEAVAARFPRMALELTLQLTTIIEATGAVPRYRDGIDSANSSGAGEGVAQSSTEVAARLSKIGAGFGAKDGADRKSLKNTCSRATSLTSFSETAASVPVGAGASSLFTGAQIRTLQAMYRGCVETLAVLMHGAAMAATELSSVGAEVSVPPSSSIFHGDGTCLGALTHAAVLRDAKGTLGFDDGVDVLVAGADVGSAPHVEQRKAHATPVASLLPRCFLYKVSDTRCLSRSLTWEALFLPSSRISPGTDAVLAARGARDDIEDAVQRSVAAFRTLTMGSSQLAIVVRVGVALESWWRSQQQTFTTSKLAAAATTARSAAKGASSKRKLKSSTTAPLSPPWSSASEVHSVALAACTQCIELLRVLALSVMIQQHQHCVAKDESALTATLLTFIAVERALRGADAPAASADLLPSMQRQTEKHERYTCLLSLAQVGQRLSQLQRRCANGEGCRVREVSLREFTESAGHSSIDSAGGSSSSGGAGGDSRLLAPALPQSLRLYSASAALLDMVTAALCAPPTSSSSADGPSGNGGSSSDTAMVAGGLHTPMTTALSVLRPVVAEVAPFLLRCAGELRSQWQRHRALRQMRQACVRHDDATHTSASAVTALAPLSVEEQEANEEAAYATVVLLVLTSMWQSGTSGGNGGMQLSDDRGVPNLVHSVESGFLQLVPALPSSSATMGAATAAAATHIPPAQLARLIVHGVTVRRLVDRARRHLQRGVESLLEHTVPRRDIETAGAQASTSASPSAPREKSSNHRQLSTMRDALTELTSLWVTVRWQLARLQSYKSSYTAQHMDLVTLQERQEQQQVYGRTTAKELRILRALEQATPVLPVTAKDEEVRLRRWVAEQRQRQSQSRMGTAMNASFLLLEALVCTALVPLNSPNPSAQQRLLDEAIRAMRQAEEECTAKKPPKPNANFHIAFSSTCTATAAVTEALVLYTPLLLWCYVAEACNVYGTREQAERVREVLDAQILAEVPATTNYTHDDGAVTTVTTSFIQRLMLQPKWSALHASSTTTRLACCRALSSMAAVDTSKAASGSDALGSLQVVYRLVLALQIQRMLEVSEEHSSGSEDNGRGTSGAPRKRESFSSSPLAVDTAEKLVSAILSYFARSSGNTESRLRPKTAAAPLLLPPLVALCEVLLGLSPSSPQWVDAAVQLLAVRVLTLFKEQLTYVMTSSMTVAGATACLPAVSGSMLQLLWTTLLHVWHNVWRNPNARQRRSLLAMTQEAQWARRVFDGHQRLMQQRTVAAAEVAGDAEPEEKATSGGTMGSGGKSGRHVRNTNNGGSEAAAGTPGDSDVLAGPVPPLDFPGVVYLAFEDALDCGPREQEEREVKPKKGDGGARTVSISPTPLFPTTAAASTTYSSKQCSASEPSTVLMHASVPAELVELFEDILFHVPALWPVIAPAMNGGAVADADAGMESSASGTAHEVVSAIISPKQQQRPQQPLIDSLADFVRFASQHAARVLRSQPAVSVADAASSPAAGGVQSALLRLQGVPVLYADVMVALQQYGTMVTHGAAATLSGTRSAGGTRGHNGGAASAVLLDVLGKYKEDPAYAKVAVHVVREMLAMCSDAQDHIDKNSGGGGGAANQNTATSTPARKRHTGSSAPDPEAGSVTPIAARSTSVATALGIIADARLIMRTVREQAEQNQRSMETYLRTVDSETRTWLMCSGYGLDHSPQQLAAANAGARETSPTVASSGKKDNRKAAAAAAAANKKQLVKRGAVGKKVTSKSSAPDGDENEEETRRAATDEPSYTTVTRVWSFAEQQKLKQLTCAIAWWRRRRAARTLRHRCTQYNMPFMAQMHLYEAALLHMGATAQYTAMTHERHLQELLRFVSTDGSGYGDARACAAVDRKLAVVNPTATSAAASTTQGNSSPEKFSSSNMSGTPAEAPADPAQTTVKLLQHCARAALLFQYVWLPTRVTATVRLAVHHLQQSCVTLPQKGLGVSSSAAITALVKQLLAAPLFCIAAVQHGYWDARRDVHAEVLQPTVVKVGADVSWHRRFRFHRSVPSLLSLKSLLGQHEEVQSVREAQACALRQRQHEQLQLRLCVESEAATRAEAERDELQAMVHTLQWAQELMPPLSQSAAVKATLLAAAELLASSATGLDRVQSRHRSPRQRTNAQETVTVAGRESIHAAAAEAAATIAYFTFESVRQGGDSTAISSARGTTAMINSHKEVRRGTGEQLNACSGGDATGRTSVGAANYGRDMREAILVEQLMCLVHVVASALPKHSEAAYCVAQRLTAGRYAGELLPLILQTQGESRGQPLSETRAAYAEALRNIPEGPLLLRAARTARAQLSATEAQATNAPQKEQQLLELIHTPVASPSAEVMLTRDPNTSDASSAWKAVVKQYQRAAQSLRAAGLLQALGECLYEQGDLYRAASHLSDAAKRWSDALDCFLATPHALEDWHRHRTVPPAPPSGRRSLEELLWIAATLSALANHAFPTDSPRATDAKLLCALLVHRYWHLPGVVSTAAASDGEGNTFAARTQHPPLPPAQYSLLDVHHVSSPFSDALRPMVVGVKQQHSPTGIPGALTDVTRGLISAAQSLLMKPPSACYSSESAVLAAFSDFVATVLLQNVELAVEARLVRAEAAAHIGSFAVAMHHIYGVCIGAGLPQPVSVILGAGDTLPGFFSLGCAAASPAGATAVAVATPLSSSPPSSGAMVSLSFYRDEESPSSPHNTAAVRAFLAACLPGLPLDAVDKHSSIVANNEAGAPVLLSLTTGMLASAALEERYGACLTRRLQLTIAEVLVRLGTCDTTFLLTAPPTVAAAAVSSLAATTFSPASSNPAGSGGRGGAGSGQSRTSLIEATATPRAGSGGGRASPPSPTPAVAGRSDRPVNACTEACRYASALLQSLASADVCFILTGQPSPLHVLRDGGATVVGAARAPSNSAVASSPQASRTCPGTSAQGAAAGASEAVAAALFTTVSKPADSGDGDCGAASPFPCTAWLGTLRAIRQHAILLAAELLAAQGRYGACVGWLTALIAEHNEAQQYKVCDQQRQSSSLATSPLYATSSTPHRPSRSQTSRMSEAFVATPSPTAPAPHSLLKGLGCQGGTQALESFVFSYDHWVRVWLLMCRCYGHLRQYLQLEEAARVQGLPLCTAFGVRGAMPDDSNTYQDTSCWTVFQLYRLYALSHMGHVRESGDVVAALELGHRAPAKTSSVAAVTVDSPMMGVAEGRWVAAAALRSWHKHQGEAFEWASPLEDLEQLVRLAITEHGVRPWRPSTCISSSSPSAVASSEQRASPQQQHYVLVSPSAHSVLPSLALSRCAMTATLWRLHDMMNHYALVQQQQQSLLTAVATPAALSGGGTSSSEARDSRRAPQQRLTTPNCRRANTSTDLACTSFTPGLPASASSSAAASLVQALEVVSPQYRTSAHASCWLESQLWAAQIKVQEVCAHLLVEARESEVEAAGRDSGGDGATTRAEKESVLVASQTGMPPLLLSREEALRALPAPVRDVCDHLLRVLHFCVELPVQRHVHVRAILLDLTRVVSTYARVIRAREHRTPLSHGTESLSTATTAEASLASQWESIAAACALLAGLVSDMERRVCTGADSLRGYATNPRVTAAAIAINEATTEGHGQTPWPESLWAALQCTQDTVGRLAPAAHSHNAGSSGAAAVLSNPFYNTPSANPKQLVLDSGAASFAGSAGAESDRGSSSGRGHRSSGKRLTGFEPPGAPPAISAAVAAQLSVPTMALTYATLCSEAAAARALTPVADALEHDIAQQLLTSHLQRLSTPANCTYLCYSDNERQALLESIGAVLVQQQQQQQQQPSRRGGSGGHSSRTSLAASSSSTNAAAGASGGGSSLPSVKFTEADVWKALTPPVLLAEVPAGLFSAVGADALGAPLYNSVAAAAVCTAPEVRAAEGGAAAIVNRDTSSRTKALQVRTSLRSGAHEARWHLYLCVSPLQDAEVATAPPTLLPGSVVASLDSCVLLPPSHILAATSTASTSSSGMTTSRQRNISRQLAAGTGTGTTASHTLRTGGQAALPSGSIIGGANHGTGGAWWPSIIASAATSTREVLVPSTNWGLLDFIQQYQQQRESSKQNADGDVKTPSLPSPGAPAAPATRGMRKLRRGISFSTSAAALTTAGSGGASNAALHHKNDGAARPYDPVPLRWTCISLEVSGSAVRTLRRHLRAVRVCMDRVEAEEGTAGGSGEGPSVRKNGGGNSKRTEDAVSSAIGTGAAATTAVEAHGAKKKDDHSSVATWPAVSGSSVESDAANDHAAVARGALAAAVAQAHSALRSRVLAVSSGGGGVGGMAPGGSGVPPSTPQGGTGDSGARAGFSSSYPGGTSSPGSAATANGGAATSPSTSSGRKTANKACASSRHPSYGNSIGGHGNAATGAGGADGLQTGTQVAHDDLADAARARQVAERCRRLQKLEEDLDEAKSSLLMELLETIVSAACASSLSPTAAGAMLDEARTEADVQRLLPRCALSNDVISFLEEWLVGDAALNVHVKDADHDAGGDGGGSTNSDGDCSGHSRTTSLRFYSPGLHEWMQRISRYVVEQQQQQ